MVLMGLLHPQYNAPFWQSCIDACLGLRMANQAFDLLT